MKAELRAKWIAALRSGDYKQAQGALRDKANDAFCCLGVLCEVAGVPRIDFDCYYDFGVDMQGDEAILFGPLAEEIGVEQTTLTTMNDSGKTFPEIADWIENNIATY